MKVEYSFCRLANSQQSSCCALGEEGILNGDEF